MYHISFEIASTLFVVDPVLFVSLIGYMGLCHTSLPEGYVMLKEGLYCRHTELVTLSRSFWTDDNGVIVIEGERSVGKSSLIQAFTASLENTNDVFILKLAHVKKFSELLIQIKDKVDFTTHSSILDALFLDFIDKNRLLVIIDDIDDFFLHIDKDEHDYIINFIKSLIVSKTLISKVFVTSKKPSSKFLPSCISPIQKIVLRSFQPPMWEEFINCLLDEHFIMTKPVLKTYYMITGGHPYWTILTLQLLLKQKKNFYRGAYIDEEDIMRIVEKAIRLQHIDEKFDDIWENDFEVYERNAVIELITGAPMKKSDSIGNLVMRRYVRSSGNNKYEFSIGLQERWLRSRLYRNLLIADHYLLQIDTDTPQVFINEKKIALKKTQYDVLCLLNQYRGNIAPYHVIAEIIWGRSDLYGSVANVQTFINRLKRQLRCVATPYNYINNKSGQGYFLTHSAILGESNP